MATKPIRLNDAVHDRLKALKRDDESFSDVVDRLTAKFALLELVGTLDHAAARQFRSATRDLGKRFRQGIKTKAGGSA